LDKKLVDEAIGRLDTICGEVHRLAEKSVKDGWPADLQLACRKLASDVETLAGALDRADGADAAIHDLANEAAENLPKDFEAFGAALAADLVKLLPKIQS
jgi:hypothetical protein